MMIRSSFRNIMVCETDFVEEALQFCRNEAKKDLDLYEWNIFCLEDEEGVIYIYACSEEHALLRYIEISDQKKQNFKEAFKSSLERGFLLDGFLYDFIVPFDTTHKVYVATY